MFVIVNISLYQGKVRQNNNTRRESVERESGLVLRELVCQFTVLVASREQEEEEEEQEEEQILLPWQAQPLERVSS